MPVLLSSVFFSKSAPGLGLWRLVGLLLREMQGVAPLQTGALGPAGGPQKELWACTQRNHFVYLKSCCV